MGVATDAGAAAVGEASAMTTIAVIAPLKYGAQAEARALIAAGPPFDPELTPLDRHQVFVTGNEAVFLFEGTHARAAVEELVGEAAVWRAALAWRHCLAGRPRIAEGLFDWRREP